ncbi:MAG: hypothetical protein QOI65_2207 [Thermoleophilaceae bacterium]|nr:hypothetical protein [Thermoleophilaceae bacterium]
MAIDTPAPPADAAPQPRRRFAPPLGAGLESWILGGVFSLYCWLLGPATSDLAAATFRSDLFSANGVLIYNAQWYDGHHLPAYSLLSPPLGALIGTRLMAALFTFGSIVVFERIVVPRYGTAGRIGAVLFAITAGSSLLIGRVAFAVGLFFLVLAVYYWLKDRFVLACVAAVGSALGSPLAGLFLAMLAGVWFLVTKGLSRRAWGIAIAVAAVAPSLILQFAFREGGTFPYGWISFLQLVLFCALFILAVPWERSYLLVHATIAAYLLAGLYAQLVPSQLGGNINRLGTIVGAPILAALLWNTRRRLYLLIALPYLIWWPIHSVIRDIPDAGGAITESSYYQPLNDALARTLKTPARIEIPPTRNHWEGVYVGKHFELARGWERQLDQKYANLFYGTVITPANYKAWLDRNAVSYVAVSDGAADFASRSESDFLIQETPSYLRPVWRNENWVLYAVADPTPLLSGPGRLTGTTADSFKLVAERPGRFVMRLHFSPYWAVTTGSGCVAPARGNWTEVTLKRAGTAEVSMSWSPIRAVRQSRPRCS